MLLNRLDLSYLFRDASALHVCRSEQTEQLKVTKVRTRIEPSVDVSNNVYNITTFTLANKDLFKLVRFTLSLK